MTIPDDTPEGTVVARGTIPAEAFAEDLMSNEQARELMRLLRLYLALPDSDASAPSMTIAEVIEDLRESLDEV